MKKLHWHQHQVVEISPERYWMLVNGKFSSRRCTACGGTGLVWVNEYGNVEEKPSGEDSFQDYCYPCDGFGFSVVYDYSALEGYDYE